jgi:tetratricopeptide (TPR) repeat protein
MTGFAGIIYILMIVKGRRYNMLFKRFEELYEQGQFQDAVKVCDLILKWTPYSSVACFAQGITLYELERYEEAIGSLDRALKYKRFLGEDLNRGFSRCHFWHIRGNILLSLKRLEESVESYNKALKFKNGGVEDFYNIFCIWANRGCALLCLNLHTEALKSFENALTYNPEDLYCLAMQGRALTELQRYEEARNSLDQALTLNPEYAPAIYGKACTYALQGNIDSAIENLAQTMPLDAEKCRESAKTEPFFDSIRSDDRFRELVDSGGKR